MPKNHIEHTWSFRELPEHPLCQTYRITERMARRAYQAGRLQGVAPGLVVLFTDADIREWILRSKERPQGLAPTHPRVHRNRNDADK